MESNNNIEGEQLPQQNTFFFDYTHNNGKIHKIKFNSVFDSGNMRTAVCSSSGNYIVTTAPDCCGTKYEGFSKSWYHFSVQGAPKGASFNFTVRKISILYAMYKNAPDAYKPVCRIGSSPWKRIENQAFISESAEDRGLEVKFTYTFDHDEEEEVYFAFSYPFSYEENKKMLENYDSLYSKDPDLYYHRELMTRSVQERDIDLVTISSHEGKLNEQESELDAEMFPNKETNPRAKRFRNNKPVVLITARVHPGETPASHTMNGILKFLLDKKDARAQLLRQYFVFMFVPMINPDGVYNGHYRMDTYNQNLNRYYKNPDPKKQPAIFAIMELVTYLHSDSRLFFYCDLHAHAAKKGCFLYGNALDFVMQVESILFAKVMSLNCINFEFDSCNFSKKHMSARDKGEKLTKEGAGRVAVQKIAHLVHSYTMECGLHFSNELNKIAAPATTKNCFEDHISDINSDYYKDSPTYYSIEIYENLGKGMLVSILDIFQKNPGSRLNATTGVTMDNLRKDIAAKVVKIHRFWKEAHVKKKCLKINELVKELFYDEFDRKNVFSVHLNAEQKLLSTTNSLVRRVPNVAVYQTASNPPKAKKLPIAAEALVKEKERQNSIVSDTNGTDENVENTEQQAGVTILRSLPKIKTPVALRDFRLKHNESRTLQFDAKSCDILSTSGNHENKLISHSTLRLHEKTVNIMNGGSEAVSLRDVTSPARGNYSIKERKNTQAHSQQPSMDSLTIKGAKKDTLFKKSASSNIKLPELEPAIPFEVQVQVAQATAIQSTQFFSVGTRTYMIAKGKIRSGIGSLVKKTKAV